MKYLNRFSEWSTKEKLIVSNNAIEDAKHSYIDTIACILAGKEHSISKKINKYNISLNQQNSIYGNALLYGCQAGILDYDDYEAAGSSHCSAPIVSSVLALIKENNFTYKQILEAWIVGYEIIISLGLSLGYSHYEKGWHAASTLGSIGVAASIGRLLKLNSTIWSTSSSNLERYIELGPSLGDSFGFG